MPNMKNNKKESENSIKSNILKNHRNKQKYATFKLYI